MPPRLTKHQLCGQASFSVDAYKHGYLKPASADTVVDNTVTRFVDAYPTVEQTGLARHGYNMLHATWQDYVRIENDRQRATMHNPPSPRRAILAFSAPGHRLSPIF